MAQLFTLGGDRIGSGQKQQIELHNFGMNSFNLEQDFKSSLAPGILYPFIKMVGTNHGTFDIDLDTFVRTLPTRGPLFGSFKLQLDLYSVPFRLYQGVLHNNPTDIGLNMSKVYLPKLEMKTIDGQNAPKVLGSNEYNYQISESSLLKYLGMSGIGKAANYTQASSTISRKFQCVPILAYYDIFKCYYSNKQEENAYVITPGTIQEEHAIIRQVTKYTQNPSNPVWNLSNSTVSGSIKTTLTASAEFTIGTGNMEINLLILGNNLIARDLNFKMTFYQSGDKVIEGTFEEIQNHVENALGRNYQGITYAPNRTSIVNTSIHVKNILETYYTGVTASVISSAKIYISAIDTGALYSADIALKPFALKNIDKMRYALLKENEIGSEFKMGLTDSRNTNWNENSGEDGTGLPYSALFNTTEQGITWNAFQQNGLVVKTYQSDLFNNWLDTEFIDGPNGISAITAVDTTSGSFTMDTLNLAEKFYELLNRILVSGGTYQDWQDAVYGEGAVRMCETPMYIGGMAAEIMFEEVIATTENGEVDQALGSLGGKGTQVNKKGGNNIHVKLDEPGYVMGIVSITPRICYSQGNDWDLTELNSLDDLHKPSLDGIGFQPLMIEQMAWWNTVISPGTSTILSRNSAGKQTAWINYQTAVDKCYGDFAKQDGYAFMVLNRNYELGDSPSAVKDITTYIDPAKYNYAFAYSELSAQNFWVQIHSKVIARRKMGAQQLPNL